MQFLDYWGGGCTRFEISVTSLNLSQIIGVLPTFPTKIRFSSPWFGWNTEYRAKFIHINVSPAKDWLLLKTDLVIRTKRCHEAYFKGHNRRYSILMISYLFERNISRSSIALNEYSRYIDYINQYLFDI